MWHKVEPLEAGSLPPHVAEPTLLRDARQLSVASGTDPKVLAGAIAGQARGGATLAVRAIGAKVRPRFLWGKGGRGECSWINRFR